MSDPLRITVLGLWHLGCVTAACSAKHFQVTGLDFDAGTVAKLNAGHAPLLEPGLDELISAGLAAKRLAFTTAAAAACAAADVLWLCHDTPVNDNDESDVIPFGRVAKNAEPGDADKLDKAGQTILQLVQRAAGIADENSRHALEMAQKLSHQLRAAEDRVAELEAEVTAYRERADRAEQWLHRVYTEIEDRFLQQSDSRRAVNGAPQRPQNAKRSR